MEIGEITDYLSAANNFHKKQSGQEDKPQKEQPQVIQGTFNDFQRLMG